LAFLRGWKRWKASSTPAAALAPELALRKRVSSGQGWRQRVSRREELRREAELELGLLPESGLPLGRRVALELELPRQGSRQQALLQGKGALSGLGLRPERVLLLERAMRRVRQGVRPEGR
jgi:hypothetical protein